MALTDYKRCTLCSEVRPLTEFPPDTRASDGRQARCRDCHNLAREISAAGGLPLTPTEAPRPHPTVGPHGHGICVCLRPVPRGRECGRCLAPIAALMHPDSRARLDRKWPGWRAQVLP